MDPERLKAALGVFGGRLVQSYGLIEAPMPAVVLDQADHQRIVSSAAAAHLLSSAGREFLPAETALVDPAGAPVAAGSAGEIIIRGPHVRRGYWNQPEATRRVLQDGWLRTGDLACRDPDGYLYLTDRRSDVIVSGGVSVSAGRIEHVLARHPSESEVAVVAAPDDYWGEVPVAVVVPRRGVELTPGEIVEFGRTELPGTERPKRVVIESALPHSSKGKLLIRVVRERFWAGRQRRVN